MRKLISRVLILLSVLSLIAGNIISLGGNVSYAEDLELIGNDDGIEMIPESNRLFDLSNLNPGDTREAKITIINNYIAPFELFMRTERAGEIPTGSQADLFGQLNLTVYMGDEEIFSGSMMDFASANISLGKFESDDTEILRALVHLPGPETGNEYQGANVEVKWIFTAQADELEEDFLDIEDPGDDEDFLDTEDGGKKPNLPKTGEIASMAFYGAGILILGLGIAVARKRKS